MAATNGKYELAFLVMIDAATPSPSSTRQFFHDVSDAGREAAASVDVSRNSLALRTNDLSEPSRTADPADGYLYFPYRLEVSPTTNVSVEQQVAFARALKERIEARGYRAVLCADFEDLLDET